MDGSGYRAAAGRHQAAARTHEELAEQWDASGDPRRADLERRHAEIERMAAELEHDRAALSEERSTMETVQGPSASEARVLRAVEILRGTTYDFRVEATIDVVNLFGRDVLVKALERLDSEIEPRLAPPVRR